MVIFSTVGIAKTGTNSLRTTIPEAIVEFLNIQAGDKILWEMKFENREKYVSVSKGRYIKTKRGKVAVGRKLLPC